MKRYREELESFADTYSTFADTYLDGFGMTYDDYKRHYQSSVNPRDVEYEPNPVIYAHRHKSNHSAFRYSNNTIEELKKPPSLFEVESGLDLRRDLFKGDEESLSSASIDVFDNWPVSSNLPQHGFAVKYNHRKWTYDNNYPAFLISVSSLSNDF